MTTTEGARKRTVPAPQTIDRDDLPPVADNRVWVVKHNPKSVSTPVTIELREYMSDHAQEKQMLGMSRLLGIGYSTANRDDLMEAAAKLEARVGNIDAVVGVY